MTTVTIVTMATMKISSFAPQNHIFCTGAIASKGLHEKLPLICVLLHDKSQAALGGF